MVTTGPNRRCLIWPYGGPMSRLLVSVSPRLFADVLVRTLEAIGVDHVTTSGSGSYDAAVTTSSVSSDVSARIVITIDATDDLDEVVRALDLGCPEVLS